MRPFPLPAAAAAALALAACGGASHPVTRLQTRSVATAPAGPACRTVVAPGPKGPQHLRPPSVRLDRGKTYTVTVATNCGTFAFTLDVKDSPKTSASIYTLVRRGFYDGLTFQRVVAGFVIQGGDPLGDGSGGPGYTVVEAPPSSTRYLPGVVAMAKTSLQPAGASGSQFFVVTAPTALPPDYALAGKVVAGMPVVQAIDRLPTTAAGYPTPAVVMSKVTVAAS